MTLIVRMHHLRSVPGLRQSPGYCLPMTRTWFAQQGLDFRAFARDGIDAERLLATGDPLALRIVEHARSLEALDSVTQSSAGGA